MKIQKKIHGFVIAFILTISLVGFVIIKTPISTEAASPGCYGYRIQGGERVYSLDNCLTPQQTTAVQNGVCFEGFIVPRDGVTSYSSISCDSIVTVVTRDFDGTNQDPGGGDDRENLSQGQCVGELSRENCGIINILVTVINFMSALAGIAIVGSIMYAGYQYMTARDNAGQIQQARQRIIWALSALFIFIFMYAFLNFLVPGGVL